MVANDIERRQHKSGLLVDADGNIYDASGKIKKEYFDPEGYRRVVCKSCPGGWLRNHEAVMEAFIGPRPTDRPVIDHINAIKLDDRLCNLEYITHAENARRAAERGLLKCRGRKTKIALEKNGQKWVFDSQANAGRFIALYIGSDRQNIDKDINKAVNGKRAMQRMPKVLGFIVYRLED